MSSLSATEAVVFDLNKGLDSHAAYDSQTKEYTILRSGHYYIMWLGEDIFTKQEFTTGDVLLTVKAILDARTYEYFQNLRRV